MSTERDTIFDFIEWLEETRGIYLMESIYDWEPKGVSYSELEGLIQLWGEDDNI